MEGKGEFMDIIKNGIQISVTRKKLPKFWRNGSPNNNENKFMDNQN